MGHLAVPTWLDGTWNIKKDIPETWNNPKKTGRKPGQLDDVPDLEIAPAKCTFLQAVLGHLGRSSTKTGDADLDS